MEQFYINDNSKDKENIRPTKFYRNLDIDRYKNLYISHKDSQDSDWIVQEDNHEARFSRRQSDFNTHKVHKTTSSTSFRDSSRINDYQKDRVVLNNDHSDWQNMNSARYTK